MPPAGWMAGGTMTWAEDRAGGGEPPARLPDGRRLTVELEAKSDVEGGRDRQAVGGRRSVAPVREQMAPRRRDEDWISSTEWLNTDHAAALVDGQAEVERRLLFCRQLGRGVRRLQ